jgi:UDP-glucose 4-epimerase
MILVTGSRGLIGSAIVSRLRDHGREVRTFDVRDDVRHDICDPAALAAALDGIDGVVHLAAISRVVWAEREPALAWHTNVDAFANLVDLALAMPRRPWIVFASSREVYGEPASLPVDETAMLSPMNVYARSKVAGEALVARAVAEGLAANAIRFSSVYGSICDHEDRVVPAFARAAVTNGVVRVEGADNLFDFTHVDDVARGLHLLVDATIAGRRLDPIHFVTGRGTTLRDLAGIAMRISDGGVRREEHAPRRYDVTRFVGNPDRAKRELGWVATIGIAEGFAQLADAFRSAEALDEPSFASASSPRADRLALESASNR